MCNLHKRMRKCKNAIIEMQKGTEMKCGVGVDCLVGEGDRTRRERKCDRGRGRVRVSDAAVMCKVGSNSAERGMLARLGSVNCPLSREIETGRFVWRIELGKRVVRTWG